MCFLFRNTASSVFTKGLWSFCEKVEIYFPERPGVELWRFCGVEREKRWKILWKIRNSFFHTPESVDGQNRKKWKALRRNFIFRRNTPVLSDEFSTGLWKTWLKTRSFHHFKPDFSTGYRQLPTGCGFFSLISLMRSSTSVLRLASFSRAELTLLMA